MARPNYGYQKRQKELEKLKKKDERKKRKSEGVDLVDESAELEQAIEEVKTHLLAMSKDSPLYHLGENVISNLDQNSAEMSLEMARVFLERVSEQD